MSANDRHVGGTHYKTASTKEAWDFFVEYAGEKALVTHFLKYVCRKKGTREQQREDLEKMKHYAQKLKDVRSKEYDRLAKMCDEIAEAYNLSDNRKTLVENVLGRYYALIPDNIEDVEKEEFGEK